MATLYERKRKHIAFTRGMAGAAMKGRIVARRCVNCGLGISRYPGAYPRACPTCGGEIVMVESAQEPVITCTSMVPRIQRLLDAGIPTPPRGPRASSTFIVRYDEVARAFPGGVKRLTTFMEGPVEGHYYRVERPEDPVIILELDDDLERANLFATTDPAACLGIDPRVEFVDTAPVQEAVVPREPHDRDERVMQRRANNIDAILGPGYHIDWTYSAVHIWREGTYPGNFYKGTYIRVEPGGGVFLVVNGRKKRITGRFSSERAAEAARTHLGEATYGPLGFPSPPGPGPRYYWVTRKIGGKDYYLNWSKPANSYVWQPRPSSVFSRDKAAELAQDRRVSMQPAKVTSVSRVMRTHPDSGLTEQVDETRINEGFTIGTKVRLLRPEKYRLKRSRRPGKTIPLDYPYGSVDGFALDDPGLGLEAPGGAFMGAQVGGLIINMLIGGDVDGPVPVRDVEVIPERVYRRAYREVNQLSYRRGFAAGLARPSEYQSESRLDERGGPWGAVSHAPSWDHSATIRRTDATEGERRCAVGRPRKSGEGQTSPYGGFRIHVGRAKARKPRKDMERALQNKRNARRGLAKRIKAAKDWHRSPDGQRLHKALGRYNERPSGAGGQRRLAAHQEDRIARLLERWRPTQHLIEATAQYAETIDDVLDVLLRKLLVIEALDILQDVEFDEDSGSVYLFFDPSLPQDEIVEVVKVLQGEFKEIGLIASPDRSLPQEQAPADWWVAYLPRTKMEGTQPPLPDPTVYGNGKPPAPGPQMRQDIVVPAPMGSAEQVADEINLDDLLKDFTGPAEAIYRLPANLQEKLARRMARQMAMYDPTPEEA